MGEAIRAAGVRAVQQVCCHHAKLGLLLFFAIYLSFLSILFLIKAKVEKWEDVEAFLARSKIEPFRVIIKVVAFFILFFIFIHPLCSL